MTRRRAAAVLLAAVAVTTAGAQAPAERWLVVPFDVARPDARSVWLGEGSAILLTWQLEAAGIDVIGRAERLDAYERLQLPVDAPLTHATVIKVAGLVEATRAVVGEVTVQGDAIIVQARPLHLDAGRLPEPVTRSASRSAVLEVYAQVASALTGRAGAPPAAGLLPPSPEAAEAYVRGVIADAPVVRQRELGRALAVAPAWVPPRLALWEAYTDDGQHARALEAVQPVPIGDRDSRSARMRAATSLLHLRRYDEAFAALKALAAEIQSAVVMNAMGIVQMRRGLPPQVARATYFFNQAAELDADTADYCFNLGYAYWLEADAAAAAYWLREAVRRDPGDSDAHFVLAAALAATGATTEAQRERELATRLSERWEAAGPRAEVPRGLERFRDRLEAGPTRVGSAGGAAVQRDQRALASFHLEAARRAYAEERDREALQEVQRAVYLSPYDVDAHLLLGRLYRRAGRLTDAVEALKIALWSRETAEAHVVLGQVLLQMRDAAGARREAARALQLEPANAEAQALAREAGRQP